MPLPPFVAPFEVLYANGFEPEDGAFFGVNGQWNEWDYGYRSSTRSYDAVVKPHTGIGIYETSPYDDLTQGASYTGFVFRTLESSLGAHAWSGPRPEQVTGHFYLNSKGTPTANAYIWAVCDGFPVLNATSSLGTAVHVGFRLNTNGSVTALLGDPGSETTLDETSAGTIAFGTASIGGEAWNGVIIRVRVHDTLGEIELWTWAPGGGPTDWIRSLYLTGIQTRGDGLAATASGFRLGSYQRLSAGGFGATRIQYDDLLVTTGTMIPNARLEWFTTAGDATYTQLPQVYDGWGDFGGYQDHTNTTTHWLAVRDSPQLETGQDEDFSEVARPEVGGGDKDSFIGELAQDYEAFDMLYWGEDYYADVNPNFPRPAQATGDILAIITQMCAAQAQAAEGTYLASARMFLQVDGGSFFSSLYRLRPRDPSEQYTYLHGGAFASTRPAGRGATLGYCHFWHTWVCNPSTDLPWTPEEVAPGTLEWGVQAVNLGAVFTQTSYWILYGTMPTVIPLESPMQQGEWRVPIAPSTPWREGELRPLNPPDILSGLIGKWVMGEGIWRPVPIVPLEWCAGADAVPAEVALDIQATPATLGGLAPSASVSNNQTAATSTGTGTLAGFAPTVTASDHQTAATSTGIGDLAGFAPTVTIAATTTYNVTANGGADTVTTNGGADTVVATF